MKKLKTIAFCAFAIITLHVSQGSAQTNVSLTTSIDSLSYMWGVNLAAELAQILERDGVLSAEKTGEENAPKLNEFLGGLQYATLLDGSSPYSIGLYFGRKLSQMMQGFSETVGQAINPHLVLTAITQVLRGQETIFATSDATYFFFRKMEAHQEAELRRVSAEHIAAGKAFLAENSQRQGVITLPSGLQYEVLREGHGEIPTLADHVRVHYHGTLIDGTVFDSSVDRDSYITLPVAHIIQGWTEALQLMPVGSKWRLWIPYDLAYGSQDRRLIRPFSVVIFEVELLAIE